MLRAFGVGFVGAVAALTVAAAVWFAVVQPLNGPGLVWGGSVYHSKQEFKLYLRLRGLSYATWLDRNPGIAPWEPGRRAVNSHERGRVWDWKRDALLSVIAALLASISAILLARDRVAGGELRANMEPATLRDRRAPFRAAAGTAVGYVRIGARAVTKAARESFRSTAPGGQHEVLVLVCAAGLTMFVGLLVTFLLAG